MDIQRRLAALYAIGVRANRWIMFSAALAWPPLAIILAKGLLGFDLYPGAGTRWIAVNFIVGLAALLVGLWISARHADRFRQSLLWTRVSDHLAGRTVARAIRAVSQVAEFAKD